MEKQIRSTLLRRAPLASLIAATLAAPAAIHAKQTHLTFADAVPPAQERVPGVRQPTAFNASAAKQPGTIAPDGVLPPTVLFSVNFDSDCSQDPPAPPPSPPAPYATPLGFTVTNVDNRTPATAVNYVTNAWIVREDFAHNVADCAMFSTSWYSPAGTANDWAAFPAAAALTPTTNTQLRWNAIAYDAAYPDGYEVRYSTAGTTPADFLANPALFTVAAENSSWTARSLTLPAALAGVPVRLAFRNNSFDKFLLLIDDIVVENVVPFDPALDAISDVSGTAQYARVPAFMQYPFDLEATVTNDGTSALTGVTADVDVLVDAALGANFTSAPVPLAAGASADVALGTGVYATLGAWTAEGQVTANEGDDNPANSALDAPLVEVTADEITRSEGLATGALGIGAGNGGELGIDFEIPVAAQLTSIRIAYNNDDNLPDNPDPPDGDGVGDMNGRQMQAVVRAWDAVNNQPGAVVFTATATVAADAPIDTLELDFPVTGTVLAPGRYLVAAVEPIDLTLSVQLTDRRFTPGTTWVDWPTNPIAGWGNNEDFGAQFAKTYRISAILGEPVAVPVAVDDPVTLAEDGNVTGNVGANDVPSSDGGNVWALDQGPTNGLLQFAADGAYTYTPAANFNGTDSFTYTLCDAGNDCDGATVTFTVDAVDDLPVAGDDAVTLAEDGSATGNVGTGDTPSGDGGNVWALDQGPTNGLLQFAADGAFTYTPAANFNGTDSFTYTLCDADNDCDGATVTLTVDSVDDLPVANDDAFTVGPVQTLADTVAGNDTAGDGATVFSVTAPPASGTLDFQPDGSFTYMPGAGITGTVTFTYQICDADSDCDPAQVTFDVLPVLIFRDGFED